MAALSPVPRPEFRLLYNQKDITADVSPYVLSVGYTDVLQGESDSLEVSLEDSDGRWLDAWYPGKGDALSLRLGYAGRPLLDCGTFEIDAVEFEDPPSTVRLKALATPVTQPLRSRASRAYEGTTLAQVAADLARAHGATVVGTLADLPLGRATQYSETDVGFLRRLAEDYGYAFKVVGRRWVFSQLSALRGQAPVAAYRRGDESLKSLRLGDRISGGVYRKCRVRHHDARTKRLVSYDLLDGQLVETPGLATSADTLHVARRADSPAQARGLAEGAMEKNEARGDSELTVIGDPRLVAGVVVRLEGCGKLSGAYLAHESAHDLSRSGYETRVQLKRI